MDQATVVSLGEILAENHHRIAIACWPRRSSDCEGRVAAAIRESKVPSILRHGTLTLGP